MDISDVESLNLEALGSGMDPVTFIPVFKYF